MCGQVHRGGWGVAAAGWAEMNYGALASVRGGMAVVDDQAVATE